MIYNRLKFFIVGGGLVKVKNLNSDEIREALVEVDDIILDREAREVFGKIQDHFIRWGFANKHFEVTKDCTVWALHQAIALFHVDYPNAWCEWQLTIIQIVPRH